jgi:6-phospho-3-hexuloisomerase
MNSVNLCIEVTKELGKTLEQVDSKSADRLIDLILASKRIFVAGAGRSGFMMRAFAMRLMHMGFEVFVVGETTTPGIEKDDVLIIGSGSGETGSLVGMAKKAKSLNANLGLITIFAESTIGQLSDAVVRIPAPTPKAASDNGLKSIQPMGNLFEQSLLLFLDCTIIRLMEKRGKDAVTMFTRHANLE